MMIQNKKIALEQIWLYDFHSWGNKVSSGFSREETAATAALVVNIELVL